MSRGDDWLLAMILGLLGAAGVGLAAAAQPAGGESKVVEFERLTAPLPAENAGNRLSLDLRGATE